MPASGNGTDRLLPSSTSSKSLLEALESPEQLEAIFSGFRVTTAARHGKDSSICKGPSISQQRTYTADSFNDATRAGAEGHDDDDGQASGARDLEAKLELSAKLGLALLEKQHRLSEENANLVHKQHELEASVSQLLDRLASSYKENAQLIKRAERAQANLDASEASNRQLLITLEEDRKTIRRLSARHEKLIVAGERSELVDAQNDLQYELEQERKKSASADLRARRATAKLAENEARMASISQQLEKTQLARMGRQSVAATRNRSRPNSISLPKRSASPAPLPEPEQQQQNDAQLQKLVQILQAENSLMQQDMQQLRDLLDISRDQITNLQTEQYDRSAFTASTDFDGDSSQTTTTTTMLSPDIDISNRSTASTNATSLQGNTSTATTDWLPSNANSNWAVRPLPHAHGSLGPAAGGGGVPSSTRLQYQQRRRSQPRIPGFVGSSLASSAAHRRGGTRAMSVDLSNLLSRTSDDGDIYDQPISPSLGHLIPSSSSPKLRPLTLGSSVGSLSSSIGAGGMGSPLMPTYEDPQAEEAETEAEIEEGPTILEISPSPVKPLLQGPSGLTATSPERQRREITLTPLPQEEDHKSSREMGVQTDGPYFGEPQPGNKPDVQDEAEGVSRSSAAVYRTDTYQSSILSSDATSDHGMFDQNQLSQTTHDAQSSLAKHERGSRTAAIGVLVEHVGRLLNRIKGSDVLSLEQRLKRQHLPGDVGHLAKSTLRDILLDIDSMRAHFRSVLDQENAAARAESGLAPSDLSSESLLVRRDFIILVKLFRDILYELGRLRTIVNRVELEPHLASKLRDLEAVTSASDLLTIVPGQADRSTAAALLAPLSRLFYGATEAGTTSGLTGNAAAASGNKIPGFGLGLASSSSGKGRPTLLESRSSSSGTSARIAPKLSASSALAPATVNVEFGGQGGIRRQVSIMPQAGDGGLAGRYQISIGRAGPSSLLQPAKRRDLSGIFAGGFAGQAGNSAGGEPWVVLPQRGDSNNYDKQGRATLRKAGSNDRQGGAATTNSRGLTQNVDAMIDNTTLDEDDDFRPNLLERTLRPRGLSDSSIHSTFMSHANPSGRLLTPAGLALSSASGTSGLHTSFAADAEHDFTTIKATISGSSSRPSLAGIRQISESLLPASVGSSKMVSTTKSDSTSATSAGQPPPSSPGRTSASTASVPITFTNLTEGNSGSATQDQRPPSGSSLSRSPLSSSRYSVLATSSGNASSSISGQSGGLFANFGAWASKASGLSSSYSGGSGNVNGGGTHVEGRSGYRAATPSAVQGGSDTIRNVNGAGKASQAREARNVAAAHGSQPSPSVSSSSINGNKPAATPTKSTKRSVSSSGTANATSSSAAAGGGASARRPTTRDPSV